MQCRRNHSLGVSSTMNIARIEFDEGDNNAQYPDCNVGYDSFRYFAAATIQPETTDLGGACGGAPPHLLVGLAVLGTTVPIALAGATGQRSGWLLVSLPPAAPVALGSCTLHTVDWSVLAGITTDAIGACRCDGSGWHRCFLARRAAAGVQREPDSSATTSNAQPGASVNPEPPWP